MSYQSGPFGPGYTVPGGPPAPPGGGGPWGPPPGGPGGFGGPPGGFGGPGYPPPPPPKKSNTGLIIGIVVAVVFVIPMCAGIVIAAVGAFAARSASEVGNDTPAIQPPAPPPQPAQPAQPAQPSTPQGSNGPLVAPAGYRAIRGIGFSYYVPVGWQELNPADLGSPLIESAQRNPVPSGGFMTNVNIAGEAFAGDGPAYGAANLIELQKVATIRDQRLATSGSRSAWDIESFWPNGGGVPYVTLQRYVTNGWKGYVITCSAGSGAFQAQRATCEAVLASFRVD